MLYASFLTRPYTLLNVPFALANREIWSLARPDRQATAEGGELHADPIVATPRDAQRDRGVLVGKGE
jgi:hypothetical protein